MPSPLSEKFGSVKPLILALVYYKITEKGTSVLKEDIHKRVYKLFRLFLLSFIVQNLLTVLTKYKISDETDEVKQFEALPLSFGTCGILLFPGYLILQQIKFSWKN